MSQASAAIIAALIGGAVSILIVYLQANVRPKRRERRNAAEAYARELNQLLAAQYESRVAYLEATVEERDRRIAQLEAVLDGERRSRETPHG